MVYDPSKATLKDAERFYNFLKEKGMNVEVGVTQRRVSSFALDIPGETFVLYIPENLGVLKKQTVTLYPVPDNFEDAGRFVIYSVPRDAVRKINKGLEKSVGN